MVQEGIMLLARLLAGFQSLTSLLTSKLGPSVANSQVGGFVYILGPCGFLQWTLLWGWEFLLLPQSLQVFTAWGFKASFSHAGTLGFTVVSLPSCSSQFIRMLMWTTSHHLAAHPLHLSCLSMPLLPVRMKFSSLTPWFLDFHTVWISGSSCWLLFLNLLLSFFWLCKEA